jgi:hypothetical protein
MRLLVSDIKTATDAPKRHRLHYSADYIRTTLYNKYRDLTYEKTVNIIVASLLIVS